MPVRAGLAEGEGLVEEAHQLGGESSLLDRAPPGDVAGIARLDLGQQLLTRLRAGALGADQEVRFDLPALREARRAPPVRLPEPGERRAGVIALIREG